MAISQPDPQQALKQYFGYDTFRPMQEEIIQSVYDKQDCLVIMPTGGGKSICYQIPAITLPGVCVVVSPLIALMKDQVEGLQQNGVEAAFINSTLSQPEQEQVAALARDGKLKLLYVSPERLVTEGFSWFMKTIPLSLVAVDEAHCISAWGHDFRPEYTQLNFLKKAFPDVPVMALTATADRVTREDISQQLGLQAPKEFVASFDRPNLSLNVFPGQKRYQQIKRFVKDRPGESGIIYCLSRKSTETLASKLVADGVNAGFYHAGMGPKAREKAQEDFITDKVEIVCATIAFGMGIDKSNVRWVIHYNLPKNIESYYQEIGRAGRDGLPSDTILFYSFADVTQLRSFIEESGQKELQLAKLERMQNYADAQVCRRRILLNYFGEALENDCGNCDVCNNPPEHIDGTVIAQKALSAIYRMGEKGGLRLVIDVLRGSRKKEVLDAGFDQIKTYGAGSDISFFDWQYYLHQFLNLGLLEIAYNEGNTLKLTPLAQQVLFEKKEVKLVKPTFGRDKDSLRDTTPVLSETARSEAKLFEALRELRKLIADSKGVPAYLVFSDASLKDMAAKKPVTLAQFGEVSGVGAQKKQLYGEDFVNKILEFLQGEISEGKKVRGQPHLSSLEDALKGVPALEIAEKLGIAERTVYQHIARLFEEGHEIPLSKYIPAQELGQVLDAMEATDTTDRMKPVYDYLDRKIPYEKIALGMAFFKKFKQKSS